MKNENVKIKKVSTNESNVSLRTVTYDIYVRGVYRETHNDIIKAMEAAAFIREDVLRASRG